MINKALKEIRLFHGLSKKELGKKIVELEIDIDSFENGDKKPSFYVLEQYAEVFEMPVSSLMFFSESLENEGEIAKSFRIGSCKLILKMVEFVNKKEGV